MKIAVLSGKGGTGKTLVSVNLAASADNAVYLDCDVEEPNGFLFFQPKNIIATEIAIKIPYVNQEQCSGCKKCVDFCKFNALAYTNKVLIFEEMCHSCGGCMLVCPNQAIREKDKIIGKIESGNSEQVTVCTGILNIGEVSGIPIIKELLQEEANNSEITIIDCPPGSACIVMESIKDADYCILVAEPTLFGCHNLKMVHELVNVFDKKYGVILNKCVEGVNPAEVYCNENEIKILGKIMFDPELGLINSQGLIATRISEKYKNFFRQLLSDIIKEVRHETNVDS